MTKIVGPSLSLVRRLLGLGPGAAREGSDLDEANVSQVIDVGRMAGRSSALVNLEGWCYGRIINNHLAADEQVESVAPYAAGALALSGYPIAVPHGYDFWLGGVGMARTSGGGLITIAYVTLSLTAEAQGLGALSPVTVYLARWDLLEKVTAVHWPGVTEAGETWVPLNMRIPRYATINFRTVSDAALGLQLVFSFCLIPSGAVPDIAL